MADGAEPAAWTSSRVHRDVLHLAEFPRRPGDIRFVSGDRELTTAEVVRCLEDLRELDLVAEDSGLWRRTDAGTAALRDIQDWEFEVEEVFAPGARRRPLVIGVVRRGVIYSGDWFVVNGTALGQVLTVEFPVRRAGEHDEQVTITVDIAVGTGDVLTRHEPMAATPHP